MWGRERVKERGREIEYKLETGTQCDMTKMVKYYSINFWLDSCCWNYKTAVVW